MKDKLARLSSDLKNYNSVTVAFSGGVDSTFLLKYVHNALGNNVVAVTAVAPNFSPDEIADAIGFCHSENICHLLIHMGENLVGSIAGNPKDRCYICKKQIFSGLLAHPKLANTVLVDGTNADDVFDVRPGEKALYELGVISPLRDAGLTKDEIRTLSKEMGLPTWDKPAFACLATRIPHGEPITMEKLHSIYSLEKILHNLGFAQVRVRHHDTIARIEVLPEDREKFFDTALMDKVNKEARECGFIYAALDLAGYKMGNMNL